MPKIVNSPASSALPDWQGVISDWESRGIPHGESQKLLQKIHALATLLSPAETSAVETLRPLKSLTALLLALNAAVTAFRLSSLGSCRFFGAQPAAYCRQRHVSMSYISHPQSFEAEVPAGISPWNRSFGVEFEFICVEKKHTVRRWLQQAGHEVNGRGKINGTRSGWKVKRDTSIGRQYNRSFVRHVLEERPRKSLINMSEFQSAPRQEAPSRVPSRRLQRTGFRLRHCLPGRISPGWEVVSPILQGHHGLREVKKMCQTLRDYVQYDENNTYTCSMHVHVNASDLEGSHVARLILFHDHIEQDIDGLLKCLSPQRRCNHFCRRTDERILARARQGPMTFDEARAVLSEDNSARYVSLNMFGRCKEFGTVEFRRHEGTTHFQEALSWITLCLFMVEASKSSPPHGENLTEALRALAMFQSGALAEWAANYLLARHEKGSGGSPTYPEFHENWLE